jgi:hypothetical protein
MAKRKEPKRTRRDPDGREVELEDETKGATIHVERAGIPLHKLPRESFHLGATDAIERYLRDLERWGEETYARSKRWRRSSSSGAFPSTRVCRRRG